MTESDIHKCLLSYGFFPMTLILKRLEEKERFEECDLILKSMVSYLERYKIVIDKQIFDEIPTQWSENFEKEYYNYFKNITKDGTLLAKENMKCYLKDIKQRLKLN